MLLNIPAELRERAQWVCSDRAKTPFNPRTKRLASPTDPSTWSTFAACAQAGFPHVGFVLHSLDPYTIIDLDDKPDRPITQEQRERHQQIISLFDTYTERSTSGRGYHLIVRGNITQAVHRDSIEAYSTARYMICTGDVVVHKPIAARQELLDTLVREAARVSAPLVDAQSTLTDDALYMMASTAENAVKFNLLWRGCWPELGYQSQSEADYALLSMLAFYSPDNAQVRRMFAWSGLNRTKATQTYLDRSLRKIRAAEPPPMDFSNLRTTTPTEVVAEPEKPAPAPVVDIALPPGIVGQIASYIYSSSIRPIQEVAIAAAIAFTAGIVGRAYNVSGSGLNHYVILLARTGAGKDGAASGIDRLLTAARASIPMVDQFLGPGMFASGQALIKALDEKPSFVSILGEFGILLKTICDPRANGAQQMLKRVLLDLYAKSGWGSILRASVYSDKDKNTKTVHAPCVSILGEATPESFYEGLDASHIASGLIPRFTIIEYRGPRPPANKQANQPPQEPLLKDLVAMMATSLTMLANRSHVDVPISTSAQALLDAFDVEADAAINTGHADIELQLWNRAHLKALKLAALVAVGCNPANPLLDDCCARWAIDFVKRDVQGVAKRFADCDVGSGVNQLQPALVRAIDDYLQMPASSRASYRVPKPLQDVAIVPFSYLVRRCKRVHSFVSDKRGASRAASDTLTDMEREGLLARVPPNIAANTYTARTALYAVTELWGQ